MQASSTRTSTSTGTGIQADVRAPTQVLDVVEDAEVATCKTSKSTKNQ